MTTWRTRLLIHPATVLSVAVLLVNDHVLKQGHPGLITGKVSDVAGVWMITSLLIAFTGLRSLGTVLAATAFAIVKSVPTAASWAAPVLGGTTLTDATDLIALAVLPGPWLLARGLANESFSDRMRGLTHAGVLIVVASSVIATTATSCDTKSEVNELRSDGDVIVASIMGGDYGWYAVALEDAPSTVDDATAERLPPATTSACVGERCFRVAPEFGLLDGDTLVYALTSADVKRYEKASQCAQTALFESVAVREVDGGVEVWVNAGMAGLVVRAADGSFRQVTLPSLKPLRLDGVAASSEVSSGDGSDSRFPVPTIIVVLVVGIGLAIAVFINFIEPWWRKRHR